MESNIRLLRISNEKLTYQNDKAEEKAKEDSATIEQLRTDLQEKTGALDELEAAHKVPRRCHHEFNPSGRIFLLQPPLTPMSHLLHHTNCHSHST